MAHFSSRFVKASVSVAWGCSALAIASTPSAFAQDPAVQAAQFSDVSFSYWARPFIEKLAEKNIIKGFPDGSFKPDEPVTRAQFAAIVRQAFNEDPIRRYTGFKDVQSSFWATPAISQAYTTGFLSGYPGNEFKPKQQIPKVQALVALTSGLQLKPAGEVTKWLALYSDATDIPDYAKPGIAAATETGLVVNQPSVKYLNPNQVATRADIAAFVYQALVNQKQLQPLATTDKASKYIVQSGAAPTGTESQPTTVAAGSGELMASGTQIKLRYPGSTQAKLVITPGETIPASFEVANDVVNAQNLILIPKGSVVAGQLVPFTVNSTPGTQFVAKTIKVGDQTYNINAISNPVVAANTQNVTSSTLQGGLTTAAARAALNTMLGGRTDIGSILSGVLLSGGSQLLNSSGTPAQGTADRVIIVDPATLVLTTQTDMNLTATTQPSS